MAGVSCYCGGFIYALAEPESGEIRYVGKAARSARQRMRAHQRTARSGGHLPVHVWLRDISPLDPGLVILERDPLDRDDAERRWIAVFRSAGMDLLNVLAGGTGWTRGVPQSPASNELRRNTLKKRGPTEGQLAGLVKARVAAQQPDVRARAGRSISLARTGKRYVENEHGTRKRYRQGCKCGRCCAANTLYQRESAARRHRRLTGELL